MARDLAAWPPSLPTSGRKPEGRGLGPVRGGAEGHESTRGANHTPKATQLGAGLIAGEVLTPEQPSLLSLTSESRIATFLTLVRGSGSGHSLASRLSRFQGRRPEATSFLPKWHSSLTTRPPAPPPPSVAGAGEGPEPGAKGGQLPWMVPWPRAFSPTFPRALGPGRVPLSWEESWDGPGPNLASPLLF